MRCSACGEALTRADSQFTYACTPICQPVMKVGDDEKHIQGLAAASQQKMKLSEGAPDTGQSGN